MIMGMIVRALAVGAFMFCLCMMVPGGGFGWKIGAAVAIGIAIGWHRR